MNHRSQSFRPRRHSHRSLSGILAGILLATAGCAVDLQHTQVVAPIDGKLIIYNAVEIPTPLSRKTPAKVAAELHDKLLLEIGALGKFRHVGTAARADQHVLVVQATVLEVYAGSASLRWMSSVAELIGGLVESYAKREIGTVSGSMGDGYLLVEVRFMDKQSQKDIGRLTIKGLSDDSDSFRTAEERIVDGLIRYMKTRL